MKIKYQVLSLKGETYFQSTNIMKYVIEYLEINQPNLSKINHDFLMVALEKQKYALSTLYHDAIESYFLNSAFPYEVDRNITVTLNTRPIFSGYIDDYLFTGGAHGMSSRSSFTYQSDTARPLTLFHFDIAFKNKEAIIQEMIRQIKITKTEDNYFPNYLELLERYFNASQFYVMDMGVILYYQLYDIAPYASGFPTFLIPYTE